MRPALSVDDERRVLRLDPWDGDRDSDAKTLRDKFVVTRKASSCAICFGGIVAGERVRAQTQQSDAERKVMTFKFCDECCRAMACYSWVPEILESRYEIGIKRSRSSPPSLPEGA